MNVAVDDLNRRFGHPMGVMFTQSTLGGPVVTLAAAGAEVVVALQGAQVLSWLSDGTERLWLSSAARLGTDKAVRGGIPVCWPWFGPHPVDPDKPAHGFVRTRLWEVEDARCTADNASITLSILTDDVDLAIWPHQAEARLTIAISGAATLSLALETENYGLAPFALSQALHTYFRVSEIGSARVEGLDGCYYIDKVDQGARKQTQGPVFIDQEVDRIYEGAKDPIRLVDAGRNAQIEIRSQGSRSAVVWNPWTAKTMRLGDMGSSEAYRQMLCIETTNAGDDMVLVRPGDRHLLKASYRVA